MRHTLQALGVMALVLLAFRVLSNFIPKVSWSWSAFLLGLAVGAVGTGVLAFSLWDPSPSDDRGQESRSHVRPEGIDDLAWARMLSERYSVPLVDIEAFPVEESVVRIVPVEVARKYTLLPLAKVGAKLTVAMANPSNGFAMDDVKFMTGYDVEPVVAPETKLLDVIDLVYGSPGTLYEPWVPREPSAGPSDDSSPTANLEAFLTFPSGDHQGE